MAQILFVDDNHVSHRLMSLILAQDNHTTISAFDGRQALECLESTQVDMIITDVNMPEMDGLTLLKQLRKDNRYKTIPVMVLTASGHERVGKEAQEIGAYSFLTQPFSSWELKANVNKGLTYKLPEFEMSSR